MRKKLQTPRSYDVRVVYRPTSVWGQPKTVQLSMNLLGPELDMFCRETFRHDDAVARIEFRAVDKHGREVAFTRFPLRQGDF